MKKTQNKKAFTFVELIVASVILVILSSIWFYSYTWLLSDSRDSQRKSDLASLKTALKTNNKTIWHYPIPWDYFYITDQSLKLAKQWKLNKNVILSSIDEIPYDPYTKTPYFYSTTENRNEFQLSLTLENWDTPIALLVWDYKTIRKDILPTIMLAISSSWWVNQSIFVGDAIIWAVNRTKFIFHNWQHNLPYELISPYLPYSDWTTFIWIIDDPQIEFWQNSDFSTCTEIKEWLKNTWDWLYQALSNTWILINIPCTFSI